MQGIILQQQQDPDLDQLVVNTVRLIMNLSANKHPIKKTNIVKNALSRKGRVLLKILSQVISELAKVYRYKLVKMEWNKKFLLVPHCFRVRVI